MKKFLSLFVVSCVSATAAFAWVTPQTPEYVCSRLNPDSAKQQCYNLVNQYATDKVAAGECDRYTDSWQTLACVRVIAGRWFEHGAVAACDRITDANLTTSCLSAIADKHLSSWQIQQCDSLTDAYATINCFQQF